MAIIEKVDGQADVISLHNQSELTVLVHGGQAEDLLQFGSNKLGVTARSVPNSSCPDGDMSLASFPLLESPVTSATVQPPTWDTCQFPSPSVHVGSCSKHAQGSHEVGDNTKLVGNVLETSLKFGRIKPWYERSIMYTRLG